MSLDTGSIPPEINPWAPVPSTPTLHSLSTHHAYSSVCVWAFVCVCVFVFSSDGGLHALYGSTCRGATEKTAVCLRETENVRKREWRANRHASQDRHFWSEYHQLCCSPSSLHLPPSALSLHLFSCHSLCLFTLPPSICTCLRHSYFYCCLFCNVLFCYKILGCRCNAPANVPCLYPFTSDSDGPRLLSLALLPVSIHFFQMHFFSNTLIFMYLCLLFVHFVKALFLFSACLVCVCSRFTK